jgi:hypothetical protein
VYCSDRVGSRRLVTVQGRRLGGLLHLEVHDSHDSREAERPQCFPESLQSDEVSARC